MAENQINREEVFAKARAAITPKAIAVLHDLAIRVLQVASGNVGKKYSGHHPENGKLLKDSGRVFQVGNGWAIVFEHPIARLHHDGASAHIMPFKDGMTSGGKPAFRRHQPAGYSFGPVRHEIHHPGFTGNPYLENAVKSLGFSSSGSLKRGLQGPFPISRASNSFA